MSNNEYQMFKEKTMVKQSPNSMVVWQLVPMMLTFFAMGFVDLSGIATNYVKADFGLSDTLANLFTSMVFLWFFLVSIPTGMLMNKIGRHKTVLLSLVITLLAVALPLFDYNLPLMIISFSLLGLGNAMMQARADSSSFFMTSGLLLIEFEMQSYCIFL